MKERKSRVQKWIWFSGLLACMTLLIMCHALTTQAAEDPDYLTVEVSGTYDQTEARAMLEYVNKFRTGQDIDGQEPKCINKDNKTYTYYNNLQPLIYDTTLEQIAMKRAAEIAVRYSHTRPNGAGAVSIMSSAEYTPENFDVFNPAGYIGVSQNGENLATSGSGSKALGIFRLFREDDELYGGQGHRKAMLREKSTHVGIAKFQFQGRDFWVMEFGISTLPSSSEQPFNGEKTETVQILPEKAEICEFRGAPSSYILKPGDTRPVPELWTDIYYAADPFGPGTLTKGLDATLPLKITTSRTWTSSNPSVVKIENGQIKAVSVGTAELTAAFGRNRTVKVPVTVTSPDATLLSLSGTAIMHPNQTQTLTVTRVPDNSKPLVWTSSNPSVVVYNGSGVIYATDKKGTSTISVAYADDPSVHAEFTVTVQHTLSHVAEIPATCTELGVKEHWYCSACSKRFADTSATTEMTLSDLWITCTGHDWGEWQTTKAPTLSEEGTEQRVCKHDASHIETRTIPATAPAHTCIAGPEIVEEVSPHNCCSRGKTRTYTVCTICGKVVTDRSLVYSSYGDHDMVKTEAEVGCLRTGHQEYWTCKYCGKIFRSRYAKTPVTLQELETPAQGHQPADTVKERATAATCTEAGGYDSVVYCSRCGEEISRTHQTIPALGHRWGAWTKVSDTQEKRVCIHDGSHVETRTVDADTRISLEDAVLIEPDEGQFYTGSALVPKIMVKIGAATLQQDKDYTIQYANNVHVGLATVTVTGEGQYKGQTSTTFTIRPKQAKVKLKLSDTEFTYSGSTKKPKLTVKADGKTLSSKDYTVTWPTGMKKVGTYTVKVALKGDYEGSASAKYEILPKKTSLRSVKGNVRGCIVQWKSLGSSVDGYQIQYSTKPGFTDVKSVTVTNEWAQYKTIKKLKSGKIYYIRIRTYEKANGKKYYSEWSKVKTGKTK